VLPFLDNETGHGAYFGAVVWVRRFVLRLAGWQFQVQFEQLLGLL
jgi:hypothetical protein